MEPLVYICKMPACRMERTFRADRRRETRRLYCMRCRQQRQHRLNGPEASYGKRVFDLMTAFWNKHSSEYWAKFQALCPCPGCEEARILTMGQTNDMLREAAKYEAEKMAASFKAVGMKPSRRTRRGVF